MKAIIGLMAALAVVMAGFVLSGGPQDAHAATISFTVQAAGANEVPAVTSGGSASAEFLFDSDTNELSYIIAVRGITEEEVTAAHIHSGAVGESGDVLYTLADEGFLQLTGSVELTDDDVEALFAGGLYLNIHSEDYPDGFARGQLNPPALVEEEDGASPTPDADASPTVVPGDETAVSPPNTGDAGLLDNEGGSWMPIALLVLIGAGSGVLLIRSRV